jgi:hypothetical protein
MVGSRVATVLRHSLQVTYKEALSKGNYLLKIRNKEGRLEKLMEQLVKLTRQD